MDKKLIKMLKSINLILILVLMYPGHLDLSIPRNHLATWHLVRVNKTYRILPQTWITILNGPKKNKHKVWTLSHRKTEEDKHLSIKRQEIALQLPCPTWTNESWAPHLLPLLALKSISILGLRGQVFPICWSNLILKIKICSRSRSSDQWWKQIKTNWLLLD